MAAMANALADQPDDESVVETWREQGVTDAPIAFRAVVRGMVEGTEGARTDPETSVLSSSSATWQTATASRP